jgi:hypothetical protein
LSKRCQKVVKVVKKFDPTCMAQKLYTYRTLATFLTKLSKQPKTACQMFKNSRKLRHFGHTGELSAFLDQIRCDKVASANNK